ncbi:forkhead box protein P1 isoform X2 [Trematomus bernacchii]|uniref:forkhead box protein P1 isoform X2 n=1 Tax=Trematomus bernacchii TaxID=40690 RepID=UPI00146EAFB9|nr:forkhead box protein P1 isoform X2 [Trematomus bernacchii]
MFVLCRKCCYLLFFDSEKLKDYSCTDISAKIINIITGIEPLKKIKWNLVCINRNAPVPDPQEVFIRQKLVKLKLVELVVLSVTSSTSYWCFFSQSWSSMEDIRQKQQRPSVLRQVSQTASSQPHEVDADSLPQSSSPHMGSSSPRQNHHFLPVRRDVQVQNSMEARIHDGISGRTTALSVGGLCRWPGCDVLSEDFPSFLKHLHSEHSPGDRSIAQWKLQQDVVQCIESQLILEKQKLIAMQLHLHLSEHKHTDLAASQWPYSLRLFLPHPPGTEGDSVQQWGIKHPEGRGGQHGPRAPASAHLLPDLVPSIECYKYNNIRPPYTYAYLIRWSILESTDKQCTLNEIYNWFTTMFFYFRHNTATWKNAVRHNLSLHKCFVRVEGGKGAVWTVDETEYQRRKGQKYHRDCAVKWISPYSHYCVEEP